MPPVVIHEEAPGPELARQQAAVFDLGRRALAGEALDVLVPEILASISCSLDPDVVTLVELLPDGCSGIVRDGRGWLHDKMPVAFAPGGQAELALRDRRAVTVEDFSAEDACSWAEPLRERGLHSGIVVPIALAHGAAYGILSVHWRAPRHIAPGQVTFVESMVFVICAALQRARAEAEIRHGGFHDPITELPNRLLFEARVSQALCRAHDARCAVGQLDPVDPDAQGRLRDSLRLESELRRGIDDGQLRLVYQPLVALETGVVVGAEALVRWEHPERGMVSPADFIPLAEETGLVVPLGAWVLEEACEQLARWSVHHPAEAIPYVSVNVSARQLVGASFPALVAEVLARTGIDPSRLALETTESALMESTASPAAVLEALRALGVRLFLDDFGTGYSSLSYLKRFPLDALKIDRSFISGIADGEPDPHIVEAIVGMATALGLDVVAEGVETAEQVEQLLDVGCTLAQGYWFSRPLTPAAMEQLLATRASLGAPRGARAGAGDAASPGPAVGTTQSPAGETVTLGRAAEALGVSATTLRRWSESGRICAVRTPGGHRRFTIAEVARMNTALGAQRARPVAPLAPPVGPLPDLQAALADRDELLATTVRALYRGDRHGGWFAGPQAEVPLRSWTDALAVGCRAGDFAGSLRATLALDRAAALAGATLLERHSFVELFGAATARMLAAGAAERAGLLGARRLFVSLRQALLAGAGSAHADADVRRPA